MRLYPLENRRVLRVKNQAAGFLRAYATNTPDRPRTAFVDLQGKIVAVADQFLLSEDEARIALEAQFVERILAHLDKYLKLGDTVIEADEGMSAAFDLDEGSVLLGPGKFATDVSDGEYLLYRVKNHLPLQGVDFDRELLLGVFDEELVSYTKGCYLGQEIIARVHYRSRPPRKLVVRRESECGARERAAMSSRVFDPGAGEHVGFVFVTDSV
ncbi:MAG: hypothetical protein HYT89_01105 [Candidatus Omnitrophica bacterium]|nr:hypothetical protein [Candidatus Omnitrophota bacterium]